MEDTAAAARRNLASKNDPVRDSRYLAELQAARSREAAIYWYPRPQLRIPHVDREGGTE